MTKEVQTFVDEFLKLQNRVIEIRKECPKIDEFFVSEGWINDDDYKLKADDILDLSLQDICELKELYEMFIKAYEIVKEELA